MSDGSAPAALAPGALMLLRYLDRHAGLHMLGHIHQTKDLPSGIDAHIPELESAGLVTHRHRMRAVEITPAGATLVRSLDIFAAS
jgi:hypothetical protein